jgi:hypothetical protein
MTAISTTSQAALEDRIFVLELALSTIGGALLAPNGWGDTGQLHQELYATVRRVLRGSDFMHSLERREAQLEARESAPARAASEAVMTTLHEQVSGAGQATAAAPMPGAPASGAPTPGAPTPGAPERR